MRIQQGGGTEMRKWINCKNCNEKFSNELARCPFCGTLTPLSVLKICATILVIVVLLIVIVGIVLGFREKDHTGEELKPSSSTESENGDSSTQNNSKIESSKNEKGESKTESSNNELSSNPSTTTPEIESEKNNTSTVSKPQEQKPTNRIPENLNGIKTADIILPTFYDATEGLKHCRDWYRPLSFIHLTYGMDKMLPDYNEQFNGDYILDIGGNIDKVMIYTYRIRFDFADASSAKVKFEKHLDDNAKFFNSQLALYKEYSPDVTGIMVIFEHDESNLTLTSRTFK